jgi:hypothetical protein
MAATEATTPPVGDSNPRLARNILSLPNCLALSAALMAPVLAVILNAPREARTRARPCRSPS